MLPESRTPDETFAIPRFELTPRDVEGFLDELQTFHDHFRSCFARSEPRGHFFNYMVGQFSELERKSIEPMALEVAGGNVRGMQRFISDNIWDEDKMRQTYHGLVAAEMGDPEGVLIVDESGFVKKGKESVGVARQYCGSLGKVENCQVGVFAAYASRHGYALVDKRLFMPETWFGEDYVERRHKCQVPEELRFHTKPQLAAEMVKAIRGEGRLPFKYVVADCLYGHSPDFLDAIKACVGVTSLVSVPSDTRCWLQRPVTTEKIYKYKGAIRSQRVVAPEGAAPLTVAALAQHLPSSGWYRRRVSEGSKGPLEYKFARKRVTLCKDDLPERTVWLVIKRTLGTHPTDSFYITGSGTGVLQSLGLQDCAKVVAWDFERNWLRCEGRAIASAESLTHAAVYSMAGEVRVVVHGHDSRLWHSLCERGVATGPSVPYGTAQMAREVQRLFGETDVRDRKIFAMAGHEDGIVAFGQDFGQALATLAASLPSSSSFVS